MIEFDVTGKERVKRRYFIKKSFVLSAGAVISAPLISNKLQAFAHSPATPSAKPDPLSWKSEDINIAWVGHATVLINFYGTFILTDPILFDRVGIYLWGLIIGPSRHTHPALTIDEIPKPDLVLLSHAHMDHMDYKTLLALTEKFPGQLDCLTAYNTRDVIEELNWKSLLEIDWNEEIGIHDIHIRAIEVKHFGWRFPWEHDRSRGYFKDGRSYNAYLIEKEGKKILFGGDTAYTQKFREAKLMDIDVAIMPIGAYRPWKWNHCNPEEALFMADEHIKAKYFVPIHCNTFKQGIEPLDEPLRWLHESKDSYGLTVGVSAIGQTLTLTNGTNYEDELGGE